MVAQYVVAVLRLEVTQEQAQGFGGIATPHLRGG